MHFKGQLFISAVVSHYILMNISTAEELQPEERRMLITIQASFLCCMLRPSKKGKEKVFGEGHNE